MIVNIRLTALLDERYDRSTASGVCSFTLRGPNGSPVATSPSFANDQERERTIAAVRHHAASAPVEHAPLGALDFAEALLRQPAVQDRDACEHSGTKPAADEHLVAGDVEESLHDA